LERGFLGFGEALAKEQVPSNPVTEPKRSQNPKRPPPPSLPAEWLQFFFNRSILQLMKIIQKANRFSPDRGSPVPLNRFARSAGLVAVRKYPAGLLKLSKTLPVNPVVSCVAKVLRQPGAALGQGASPGPRLPAC
jgi:hypothetical protein